MPPTEVEPWTGVRDAFELGSKSPQAGAGEIPEVAAMDMHEAMGEDCLRLNVWTSGLRDGHKRPVMVWLHGGGYAEGSGGYIMYDGANLAGKHDVVMVTVNHRLNIFGYLYLADLGQERFAKAANAGQLDIIAALEWVRDNIGGFGGDPSNVTIFGQSGGGGKVSTLMAMPAAKGLFHRAIVQSAAALKGVPRADATQAAETILGKLSLRANQLEELQRLPMGQLLNAMRGPGPGGPGGLAAFLASPAARLAPVVDGRTLPNDPFDPVAPEVSANVPLLIGSNETEVTFSPTTPLDPMDDAALLENVKRTLRIEDPVADRLISIYRKSRPKASNIDLYLILASDAAGARTGSGTEADRKAAQGKAAVYKYYFQWYTPVRAGKLRSLHTLEIPFVFDNIDLAQPMTGYGEDRYALAEKMSRAWVAFARTGNPNHRGLPMWPAFNPDQRATMIFNSECKVVNDPYGQERKEIATIQAG